MYISQKTNRAAVTAESRKDFLQYNNLARNLASGIAFYFPYIEESKLCKNPHPYADVDEN